MTHRSYQDQHRQRLVLGLRYLLLDITEHLPFCGNAVCQVTDFEECLLIGGIIEAHATGGLQG